MLHLCILHSVDDRTVPRRPVRNRQEYREADEHRSPYHPRVTPDLEAGVRIAWSADGFDLIQVQARWRSREEFETFARGVADAALFNRTLPELRSALRREFPGLFDLETIRHGADGARVMVRFHPPPGRPNPDPHL